MEWSSLLTWAAPDKLQIISIARWDLKYFLHLDSSVFHFPLSTDPEKASGINRNSGKSWLPSQREVVTEKTKYTFKNKYLLNIHHELGMQQWTYSTQNPALTDL